jgi:hypothetical protein
MRHIRDPREHEWIGWTWACSLYRISGSVPEGPQEGFEGGLKAGSVAPGEVFAPLGSVVTLNGRSGPPAAV